LPALAPDVHQKSGNRSTNMEESDSRKSPSGREDEEDSALVTQLRKEKHALQQRLEFVEELVGPTEAQRKTLQEQVLAARETALKAKYRGASVPTKVAGRLDERLLWQSGLCERDAGLLQGGCLPDNDGILQDVSVLGDPNFGLTTSRPVNLGGMLAVECCSFPWGMYGAVLVRVSRMMLCDVPRSLTRTMPPAEWAWSCHGIP